mmetsp:Transcript_24597/g.81005  ORF Transcript_24597/g.81005 Transcript_24597/m.81005 type:complete len:141 (+) Transcript_24597:520-942(+)
MSRDHRRREPPGHGCSSRKSAAPGGPRAHADRRGLAGRETCVCERRSEGWSRVVSRYDEIVWAEPSAELRARLSEADKHAPEKGWRSSKHAKWFCTFEPEPQEAEMKACYERITQELRAASRRRIEMEEEIRQLRAEPAD